MLKKEALGYAALKYTHRKAIRETVATHSNPLSQVECQALINTIDALEAELAAAHELGPCRHPKACYVLRDCGTPECPIAHHPVCQACDREKAAEQAIIEEAVELIRLRWCPDDSHQIVLDVRSVLKDTFALSRYDDKWKKREKAAIAAARLEEAEWWFTRVAMAALGEDPQSECHERIAPLRGEGQ